MTRISTHSNWSLPYSFMKRSQAIKSHLPVTFTKPEKRECMSRPAATQLFNKWWLEGLNVIEGMHKVAVQVPMGSDYFSVFLDLGLLTTPGIELTRINGNPFKGPLGLCNWCLYADAAISSGLLQKPSGQNFRVPPSSIRNLMSALGNEQLKALGYKYVSSWTHPIFIYAALIGQEKYGHLEGLIGNQNQTKLAERTEISHLGNFFTAVSALGLAGVLNYRKIDMPLETFSGLIHELANNFPKYIGNKNQVSLAVKTGITNLGHLHSALSAMNLVSFERLNYQKIDLPLKAFEAMQKELESNFERYIGDENQVKLAEASGISNLGHLFSAVMALDLADKFQLNYHNIDLPVMTFKALQIELDSALGLYTGDENQVKLAEKVGISNLGSLYSAISAMKLAEKLHYQMINLPVKTFKILKEELVRYPDKYIGDENQIKLAGKVGISNLSHLYTAVSALGLADRLKYRAIKLSVKTFKALKKELEKHIDNYIGDENQIKLADKIGISNLGALYSAVSALNLVNRLRYQMIDSPVENIRPVFGEMLEHCRAKNISFSAIINKSF